MAQRWVQKDEMMFRVHNTHSSALIVAGSRINPGRFADIPARHLVGNVDRCIALSLLVSNGRASVFPKYDAMGFNGGVNGSTVTPCYIRSLQAATGMPFGMTSFFDAASRPDYRDVPEGFNGYNTATNLPNYSDGSAYTDATGLPA